MHKPKPNTKKVKGIVGATQTSVVTSLCELKSTPPKIPSKPSLKKKGKEEGKSLKDPPSKGKNVVGKDSKGDMVVMEMVVNGDDTII